MSMTRKQALDLFQSEDLIGLGQEADAVRRSLHPEGVVTYLVERGIDCGGFRDGDASSVAAIHSQAQALVDKGSSTARLITSDSQRAEIALIERLFRSIKESYPQLSLRAFSTDEILSISNSNSLSLNDVLLRLQNAGLDSLSSDLKPACDARFADVHRAAHRLGISTTATVVFGAGESHEQRVDRLEAVRSLQQETGGFSAFAPWTYPAAARGEEATAVEYLKVLSICRLYLDNIENVQASWAAQGLKVLQLGLRFGGNDAGSVVPEEDTAKSTTEEEVRRIIRDAGFRPAERDAAYRTIFLN